MSRAAPARIGLFLLVCAALVAVAVGLSPGGPPHPPPGPSTHGAEPLALAPAPATRLLGAARRQEARLAGAGRRFVVAFLRYEVGDLSGAVRAALRASATPHFARELLASPRPSDSASHSPARIERIDLSFLAASGRRALLTGVAQRPDGPEEFAFAFERRGGRWLATGAAE